MAINQYQGVDKDGNAVTIYVTDDPPEGGGSTLNDIVVALNDTLTVKESGDFNVSVSGESAGLAQESTLSGLLTESRFEEVVNNNNEVKTTASLSTASVLLEADDSQGNGVQTIQRADGIQALKVADVSALDHSNNSVTVYEPDHNATTMTNVTDTVTQVTANGVTASKVWVGNLQEGAAAYLHFYKGSGNAIGSPDFTLPIPKNSGGTEEIGPIPFPNGFEIAATTNADGTGSMSSGMTATIFHR